MRRRCGLAAPFQRDGRRDFVSVSGDALLRAQVHQVLTTRKGELAWDTEWGSLLHTLRHARPDAATFSLARTYTADAIGRALPFVRVRSIRPWATGETIHVDIAVVSANDTETALTVNVGGAHVA